MQSVVRLESLSKTTKTKAYLTIFVGRHWWLLNVSSHVSLFMNTDLNSCPDPEKTARHETISRLCPSAFVRNEVHNEFCQNIRCERRQKNEDGIWIHVSLFCPDQGKDLSQHSQTAGHESLICLHS
jgi:hypothetical protein